ncbi:MAG: MgtC/SapB family protein [Planctomycetes bacterium]|nr:MgtC/SapB family protein [Planctomycetota bacterium]
MAGRLGLALVLGGAIGLERETHSQAAGLRTHMVVSIGAALIMLISLRIAAESGRGDPGRVAAQVVSGIGFLGAGAIIRYGMTIRGLTTAACLWTSAGIGMACGMGYWKGACAATALVLVATFVFDKLEHGFLRETQYKRFVIESGDAPDLVARIEGVLTKYGIQIKQRGLHQDFTSKTVQVTLTAATPQACKLEDLMRELDAIPEVHKVEVE